MSRITTHVLDSVLGKPAAGVAISLEVMRDGKWGALANSQTDSDGRCRDLIQDAPAGMYRLMFATGLYFASLHRSSIYPEIAVTFQCLDDDHYHLPLLLSDNCYTTYRGS